MLKSVLRITVALVIVLAVVAGLLLYANVLTGGKTLGKITDALQHPGDETSFYLTGGDVKAPWLSGYDLHAGYFGSGARVLIYDNWRYSVRGDLVLPKITLQRKVGDGAWTDVVENVPFTDGQDLIAYAPAYTVPSKQKSMKVLYRFASVAHKSEMGQVVNTSYSSTVSATYENQRQYTGLAKTIYGMMADYCPNSAVHVAKKASEGANEAGAYTEGMLLIEVSPKIQNYSPDFKRTVALHECTHERQFLNYGSNAAGWQQMEVAVARVFKDDVAPPGKGQRSGAYKDEAFNPVEHAADCGAYSVNPGGYLGYGGYCNPAELKAAKQLLLGKQLN